MNSVTVLLSHISGDKEHVCTVCGAAFVPSYDSGSRRLSITGGDASYDAVLCGGCHSKWAHGKSLTLRETAKTS